MGGTWRMSERDLPKGSRQLIECISQGLTTSETALVMNQAEGSIETYRSRLYELCNVKNAPHLVNWAYQNKILTVIE